MTLVTPDQIRDQRARGWPDMHPEDYCHQCGRPNISWATDGESWAAATATIDRGVLAILCPCCFVELFVAATGRDPGWTLSIDPRTAHVRRTEDVP